MGNTTVLEKLPRAPGASISNKHEYDYKRVYIFATRQGVFFIGLLMIMLIVAVQYSNSMAYLLTFLLASLLMVSMLHTYRNLRSIIVSTSAVNPVFVGELIRIPLLFDNRYGIKRIALGVEITPEKRRNTGYKFEAEPLSVNLEPGNISRVYLSAFARSRGYFKPGRIKISSCFPLGLFRSWAYLEPDQFVTVYPKPEGTVLLPSLTDFDAEESTGSKKGADDFTGFKPYQAGDAIRNIDWKSFAKEQPLQVKRFSGSGSRKLMIFWTHCSHISNDEKRLSQLCLWLLEAEKEGYAYGMEIPGQKVELGNGDNHLNQCLTALARYGFTDIPG